MNPILTLQGDPGAAPTDVERETAPVLDALLRGGPAALVPVTGVGMRPALVEGDLVVVSPFLGLPRPGQIVVARAHPADLDVLRLVDVEMRAGRRIYLLQGDAGPATGAGVLREALLGRVTAVVRDGRRLSIEDRRFAPVPRSGIKAGGGAR